MFTSRSAVECYKDCNRYRYNQYFLQGTGLVRAQKSVPLVTGTAIHRGVEHLLNRVRIGETPDVDTAVQLAVNQYVEDVGTLGFLGKAIKTDRAQWFTYNEQKALTEALIRAWYLKELPRIVERYKVLGVERDIEPIEIAPGVMFQAKVDGEFQDLQTMDYVNYSLKSCAEWNSRMEDSYKSDLQGVTEIWAMEEDTRRANLHIDNAVSEIQAYADQLKIAPKQLVDIAAYLSKKKVDKRISGIRFCFLVKGKRFVPPFFKDDPEAPKVTYNPLIRGYKRIDPSGVLYAHSWKYPNPNNKSGEGVLGAGWEPFNVWETDFGVKGWVEMIEKGEIQPDCGDVIKSLVVTPTEVWRDEEEMREAMLEIRLQESSVESAIRWIQEVALEGVENLIAGQFSHNRKHCYFHFGDKCEYMDLCWDDDVKKDPIGSGLYQIRTPHHDAEREMMK